MSNQAQNDPRRATPGDEFRKPAPLDSELQADPELAEGPAGGGRIAIYAVAAVVVLGAVFYGLNNSATTTTATNPPATTTADSNAPPAPGTRNAAPNSDAGTTTGAATKATPTQPPQSNPTGTQVDRNKGATQ